MRRKLFAMAILSLLATQARTADPAGATSEPGAFVDYESPRLRTECALNLTEISKQLFAFASARHGALPSKLSEAYAGMPAATLGQLVCPAARPSVVPGGFRPAYAYVHISPGGLTAQKNREDLLVFDAEPVHDGGRNVLLADLETVAYMKEADFQAALAEQRSRWEAQGKRLIVVQDDVIPLEEPLDLRRGEVPERSRRSFFASVHFKVAATIVLAMAAVAVALVLRQRERDRAAAESSERP